MGILSIRGAIKLEVQKIYPKPRSIVLNTIHDIIEFQNAKVTFSDTFHGKINFIVRMYNDIWEHRLTVTDLGQNQCSVKIEMNQGTIDSDKHLKLEFALLDSLLI